MKRKITSLIAILFILTMFSRSRAQYFQFDGMPQNQINKEVEVILKFFGSIVGGGMYDTADLHSFGGLDLGLRGVVGIVPDEFKQFPVFSQENLVGLAFLHGSLGLPGPFELFGRFFYFPLGSDRDLNASPPRAADSRGGVTLIGVGLKYGLLQLPLLPKVMVMGAYHALLVPDEFDFGTVSTVSFKGVVSQSFLLFTLYVGGGIDFTSLKLNDEFGGDRQTESLPQATVGLQVRPLPLIHVNGSYNISEFPSFELGVGISFR
ncbi:MAG: hypothetical protein D6813_04510 [Calditrichaeota bacterium]|nr:MAG: hypothetical protein D6813_04510 [Calditrichota bacterium]